MTGVDDLVTWLRAQLDRQEAALIAYRDHRASEGQCVNVLGDDPADYDKYDTCALHIRTSGATEYGDVDYGLVEVEAKRLRLVVIEHQLADDPTDETAHYLAQVEAMPYGARDGYRAEWRPEPW